MKKITYSILLVILVLFVVSCSSNPEKKIIGKWKDIETGGTTEFFSDGTMVVKDLGLPTLTQSYKILDKTHLKIIDPITKGQVVLDISLSRNKLAASFEGEITKYRRVKQ